MKLFNKDKLPSSEAIRYAEEQTKIYKQQVIKATNDYIQLQSNWNSLRNFFEKGKKEPNYIKGDMFWNEFCEISLDKMNELEGVDNENNRFIK